MRGLVGKDIGRLQHRIGVKAKRRAFAVLARFLLELRHAVQPAEPGGAVEQPGKLGMGGHARLVEQDGLRRIYARGEQRRRHVAGVGAQLRRVVADRDRVQIGEEEQAVTACRSEEHTSELQSLMRISYAVFCLKKKKTTKPMK